MLNYAPSGARAGSTRPRSRLWAFIRVPVLRLFISLPGTMRNLISIRNLSFSVGTQRLFDDVSFSINEGDRIGLVGHNGSGKSTLLGLLSGEHEPDEGEIARQRGLRLEAVEQFLPPALADLNLVEAALDRLPPGERAERAFEADRLLGQLGFCASEHGHRVGDLSGGQQNRLMFARAIIAEPEIVLFDEPTNHLDLATLSTFEHYLSETLSAAFVLISHDRTFLDRVTRRTLMLRDRRLYHFDLAFSAARHALAEQDVAAAEARRAEEKRIKSLQASAKRLANWGRTFDNEKFSRRAKNMERRVERLESEKTFVSRGSGLKLELDLSDTRAGRVVKVDDWGVRPVTKQADPPVLFHIDDLLIRPGERLALLGPNGVGKSSFIRRLVHHFRHDLDDTTHIAFSPQIVLGYYDQELEELDRRKTIIDYLRDSSDSSEREIRGALINGGFPYAEHERPIDVLSGGERARVVFVRLRLGSPNFLVLDEPTNHIDVDGREQLEAQLLDSQATLLITSHDRRFIDNVANRFMLIRAGRLTELDDPRSYYHDLLDPTPEPRRGVSEPRAATEHEHSPEDLLERLVELERKLAQDLARKPKHQKPALQSAWREEIEAINQKL